MYSRSHQFDNINHQIYYVDMYLFSLLGKAWFIFELPPSVTSPKAFSVTLEIGPAWAVSSVQTL